MRAQQAPRGRFPFGRLALTLAAMAAGCALIALGLPTHTAISPSSTAWLLRAVPAASSPSPTASLRRAAPAASSRGGRPSARGHSGGAAQLTLATQPLVATRAALTPRVVGLERATPVPTAAIEVLLPPTPLPRRSEVIIYEVQAGDNLYRISQLLGVSQDTVAWANPEVEADPDQLRVGQHLYVLPVDGVWHTVQAGETLDAIAKRYGVTAQDILDYAPNGLADAAAIAAGQKLIVPGGVKPSPPAARKAAAAAPANGPRLMIPAGAPTTPVEAPAQPGRFAWPAQGVLTQGYGKWHGAIDIANKQGTPILAAEAGVVTFASPSGGLGNAIRIDHGDGFATAYGHLYTIGVQVGQQVNKGDQIGEMGTTGHSTGPHLHLILTYNDGIVNPLDYLPQ